MQAFQFPARDSCKCVKIVGQSHQARTRLEGLEDTCLQPDRREEELQKMNSKTCNDIQESNLVIKLPGEDIVQMEFFNLLNSINSANVKTKQDYVSRMSVDSQVVQKLIVKYDICAMTKRKKRSNNNTNSNEENKSDPATGSTTSTEERSDSRQISI